jgi:hypothetical protein
VQHIEVCRKLEREIELNGSLRRAAVSLRVSPQYLSAALSGERSIGPKLLKALRLRREITKVITYKVIR